MERMIESCDVSPEAFFECLKDNKASGGEEGKEFTDMVLSIIDYQQFLMLMADYKENEEAEWEDEKPEDEKKTE